MNIKFYRKNVYGNDYCYPATKVQAEALQILTNKKTLNDRDLEALKLLGFTLEEVMEKEKEL